MFHRILVLAPHTDDGELGCGGAMAQMSQKGIEVYYAAFSTAEKSVPPGWKKDVLRQELQKAAAVLGIKPAHLFVENFPVRDFPAYRQDILEKMIHLRQKINPDLVLLPSPSDLHQDHYTIAREGTRAFKKATLIGYELPWNNLASASNCFIPLTGSQVQKKIDAVKCYASQSFRSYASEDFIRGLARTRGIQAGVDYAEAFDTIRLYLQLGN